MRLFLFGILLGISMFMDCWADEKHSFPPHTVSTDTLLVGLTDAPPFVILHKNGQHEGICIDLWEHIAKELGIPFRYQTYELVDLLCAVSSDRLDLSIDPLTVTSHRIQDMQFSMPFFSSRLAIAARQSKSQSLFALLKNFFSWAFLKAVALLFCVLLFAGFLIWLVEHHTKNNHFGDGISGLGQGIWWSAVTMTTVGYGDTTPKTALGKFIAVIWMFTSIIIISSFTASIASSLTINQIQGQIQELNDLHTERVGTLIGSSSEEYLEHHHIRYQTYTSVIDGLNAVQDRTLDAFVYDEPILQYLLEQHNLYEQLTVIPQASNISYYSFATPKRSQLLYAINPILVKVITNINWENKLKKRNVLR